LAVVVGSAPLSRGEVVSKVWDSIHVPEHARVIVEKDRSDYRVTLLQLSSWDTAKEIVRMMHPSLSCPQA
jgi:hypothetical protein